MLVFESFQTSGTDWNPGAFDFRSGRLERYEFRTSVFYTYPTTSILASHQY